MYYSDAAEGSVMVGGGNSVWSFRFYIYSYIFLQPLLVSVN